MSEWVASRRGGKKFCPDTNSLILPCWPLSCTLDLNLSMRKHALDLGLSECSLSRILLNGLHVHSPSSVQELSALDFTFMQNACEVFSNALLLLYCWSPFSFVWILWILTFSVNCINVNRSRKLQHLKTNFQEEIVNLT